jgi:hypothetical protein
MSTATAHIRNGVSMQQNRKQELEQIARKVKALRAFTKDTGYFTTRSVGQLLQNLDADELATVAEMSMVEPQKQ